MRPGADRTSDFVLQPAPSFGPLSLASQGETRSNWVIVPKAAGLTKPTFFQVYALIEYQSEGRTEQYLTVPQWILVSPAPKLEIKYEIPDAKVECLEFDVRAKIKNTGFGVAATFVLTACSPRLPLAPANPPIPVSRLSQRKWMPRKIPSRLISR
ncbi:MAG: hypothetical protein AB9888_12695 [Bacteroidales bacterium]